MKCIALNIILLAIVVAPVVSDSTLENSTILVTKGEKMIVNAADGPSIKAIETFETKSIVKNSTLHFEFKSFTKKSHKLEGMINFVESAWNEYIYVKKYSNAAMDSLFLLYCGKPYLMIKKHSKELIDNMSNGFSYWTSRSTIQKHRDIISMIAAPVLFLMFYGILLFVVYRESQSINARLDLMNHRPKDILMHLV